MPPTLRHGFRRHEQRVLSFLLHQIRLSGVRSVPLRATRIDPRISDVPFDLGSLCESSHGQVNDGARNLSFPPRKTRLSGVRSVSCTGTPLRPTTRINSCTPEVQFDLGSFCESCYSQISDGASNWCSASRRTRPNFLAFDCCPAWDASDAYLRATRSNYYISEVQSDLESLYRGHIDRISHRLQSRTLGIQR
jgi:hypothetical protein